ncbi:CoA-binding protein [Calothrix sp. FACHB-1219]|uniref:CoA-binding protein n=1 Tax=unclassified Calothrix TaxID=2619626 RepID=UPI0016891245|nr:MULTISPECIES: CoA-binding protein [unclassified Calothrix]MBD2201993.1 CoA-binding protein [Calothrix sp. FACHB-168]MBD2217029.1 CoA-binding protein [Calothrix sp. FACHB-1219]
MPNLKNDRNALREVLTQAKAIAVVGHSDKPNRVSYQIAQFLQQAGYIVYPVNPLVTEIDGKPCYPSLREIPATVDIVNIFRRAEYLSEIIEDAIAINAKTIWAQLGIWDRVAEQQALDAGLNVIMDACIKIEYLQLGIASTIRQK